MKTLLTELKEYIERNYGVNHAATDIKEKIDEMMPRVST